MVPCVCHAAPLNTISWGQEPPPPKKSPDSCRPWYGSILPTRGKVAHMLRVGGGNAERGEGVSIGLGDGASAQTNATGKFVDSVLIHHGSTWFPEKCHWQKSSREMRTSAMD
ncbi:hypothetical protein LX36DRAFT_97129 [Colletotrichum falcatum]|nr:hypothetical protein LX36DRAFT_97129 [Colletotrichum falcatum]